MKKIITAILIAIFAMTAMLTLAACDTTSGNEPPVIDQTTPNENGGLTMDQDLQGHGMRLSSVKIPRPQFAEEGIEPLAESAIQITATVTPADAVNKELDWTIEWSNANSTWAKGKTVTDYVTLTPTSDGALTANVACLQPFAEKIIIHVAVRTDTGLYAEAVVDYEKRALGYDFQISASGLTWTMTMGDTSPVVDFPLMTSNADTEFEEDWDYSFEEYDNQDRVKVNITPHYSIYTVDKNYDSVYINVAPTAEYLSALSAAGATGSMTAGQFVEIYGDDINSNVSSSTIGFGAMLLCNKSGFNAPITNYQNYSAFRNALRANVGKTMLQVQVFFGTNVNADRDAITTYNVKFSEESLIPRVDSITLNPGSIKF